MINKIKAAIKWRINFIEQQRLKLIWDVKRFFDFSQKEKIRSISVIVIGRNDNYGGDFSLRLQTTLDWNLARLPNPELIYVEWNKIKERKSDCEWITKRYANAKCYVVPNEIHKKISLQPDKMPVMEYFAKNLGIRKATNDWILILNADVFIGSNTEKKIAMLNEKTVYGTHYVSIKWDGQPLNPEHQKNKKIIVTAFSCSTLDSVVGNFILTHKNNWLAATGYDESLNNARMGVDKNGLWQLQSLNLKTMVLGHHFHLDHLESIIHGRNDSHGNHLFDNIPYKNPDDWGLINYPLKQISERIWELQLV